MNAAFTQVPPVSKTEPVIKPLAQPTTSPAATPVKGRGKPSQYWLHDEDRRALRNLAAWLAAQGERPTDSLVVRSVLQMATAGPKLLKAYRRPLSGMAGLKQRETHQARHPQRKQKKKTRPMVHVAVGRKVALTPLPRAQVQNRLGLYPHSKRRHRIDAMTGRRRIPRPRHGRQAGALRTGWRRIAK